MKRVVPMQVFTGFDRHQGPDFEVLINMDLSFFYILVLYDFKTIISLVS